MSPELLEMLACPCCESRPKLIVEGEGLRCSICHRLFPIVDGIARLLPENGIVEDGKLSEADHHG